LKNLFVPSFISLMLRPAVKRNDGIELLKMRVPAGSIREKEVQYCVDDVHHDQRP
jgi:hypothetical protein